MRSAPTRRTCLAASLRVPATCVADQQAIVRSRVLALAPVLAALTLAWTLLDMLGLPREALLPVVGGRALIAGGLLALAVFARRLPSQVLLRLFVWLQALGFAAMQAFLVPEASTGPVALGYGLAPFVLAAQIGLFPVTWLQALRLGLAPAAALALAFAAGDGRLDAGFWRDAWLLGLLLGMAAWTSHAQLGLLAGLNAARGDASRDALTGLGNRRAALALLGSERERGLRRQAPLSVLMLDLDRFKAVNDRWGHPVGDRVLVATAQAIAAELRGCDLGARFGGEEFLVVLPDTGLDEALRVAERIRRRIAALEVAVGSDALRVTVSIGVARLRVGEDLDALIARADAALYRAKSEGRDRCVADAGAPATAVIG